MRQCVRSIPRSVAAPARSADRLVIPWTTSTDLFPFTVLSRVTRNPCFRPLHFWPAVRIRVASNVRLSRRPCPLSDELAAQPGGGDAGTSSGGSGRRDPPGGVLEGEPGLDVHRQPVLVVLHHQDVVAPGTD